MSRSLGELALALGRVDEACALLTEAVAAADEIGMRFESVIARRLLATALLECGDGGEARRMADEALLVARDGGYGREIRLLVDLIGT